MDNLMSAKDSGSCSPMKRGFFHSEGRKKRFARGLQCLGKMAPIKANK